MISSVQIEGGKKMREKIRNYPKLAKDILETVGGESNVVSVSRCATRLRLVLREESLTAKQIVSNMPGVITVVENGGQFQIVIGQHVGDVYDEFVKIANVDTVGDAEENKGNILNRVIATMSAVFAPFVYILAAAGILQGMLIIVTLFSESFATTGTYQVLNVISWAPFMFLPIFVAVTSALYFKTNMYIAIVCAAALLSPMWNAIATAIASGESLSFLGLPLSQTTYGSTVLPSLFLVWILSYVEHFLNKHVNETIKPLVVPLLCMVIIVPLTFVVVGPLSNMGANAVANGYNYLAENMPQLAGALIGGFVQVLVIFGIHWGLQPIFMANYAQYGFDSFQAYQTIAVIAQVGAVLGVFIKTKRKQTKSLALSAGITGIFGITEPALYGINLRFKKPFIIGCASGLIGAVTASFFKPYYYAYAGLPGPLTIVNAINSDNPNSFIGVAIGSTIALLLPILLIQFLGYGTDITEDVTIPTVDTKIEIETVNDTLEKEIFSPLSGKVIHLSDVPDPVFSSEAMGKGFAVEPSTNKVLAPFDGRVVMTTPSNHAIGICSNTGIELLIHVGLDTVQLNGEGYTLKVTAGENFKKGDELLIFDSNVIQSKGYSLVTPIIITNSANFREIKLSNQATIQAGEKALDIVV